MANNQRVNIPEETDYIRAYAHNFLATLELQGRERRVKKRREQRKWTNATWDNGIRELRKRLDLDLDLSPEAAGGKYATTGRAMTPVSQLSDPDPNWNSQQFSEVMDEKCWRNSQIQMKRAAGRPFNDEDLRYVDSDHSQDSTSMWNERFDSTRKLREFMREFPDFDEIQDIKRAWSEWLEERSSDTNSQNSLGVRPGSFKEQGAGQSSPRYAATHGMGSDVGSLPSSVNSRRILNDGTNVGRGTDVYAAVGPEGPDRAYNTYILESHRQITDAELPSHMPARP